MKFGNFETGSSKLAILIYLFKQHEVRFKTILCATLEENLTTLGHTNYILRMTRYRYMYIWYDGSRQPALEIVGDNS